MAAHLSCALYGNGITEMKEASSSCIILPKNASRVVRITQRETSDSRVLKFHHCCPFIYSINFRSHALSRLARFLRAPKLLYGGAFGALAFPLDGYEVAFQAANAATGSTLLLPGCGFKAMVFSISRARLRLKVHSSCVSADTETEGMTG